MSIHRGGRGRGPGPESAALQPCQARSAHHHGQAAVVPVQAGQQEQVARAKAGGHPQPPAFLHPQAVGRCGEGTTVEARQEGAQNRRKDGNEREEWKDVKEGKEREG